jgi:hypothetical protein
MRKLRLGGRRFVDLQAQFTTSIDDSTFTFVVRTEGALKDATITKKRDPFSDTLPEEGCFGLPEYDGKGLICRNVHTVRLCESDANSLISGLKDTNAKMRNLTSEGGE